MATAPNLPPTLVPSGIINDYSLSTHIVFKVEINEYAQNVPGLILVKSVQSKTTRIHVMIMITSLV